MNKNWNKVLVYIFFDYDNPFKWPNSSGFVQQNEIKMRRSLLFSLLPILSKETAFASNSFKLVQAVT